MILAFELSTRRGSLALHDGSRVVAQRSWEEPAARHPGLYGILPGLLQEAGVDWAHLTAYAVGRGPGSFSGVRVALTVAQALALPSRQPVIAVSSGEALALDVDAPSVVVAGDARRGAIWYGVFHRRGPIVHAAGAWSLAAVADFPGRVPAGARVVTSDPVRLIPLLPADCPLEERYPSAPRVAELAWMRLRQGHPGDPPEPLYLHAAV